MTDQDDRDTLLPCPFRLVMITKGMGYDGCANMMLTDDTEFPVGIIPSALVPFLQNYIDNWNTRDDSHLKQKYEQRVVEAVHRIEPLNKHGRMLDRNHVIEAIHNLRGTEK